MTCNIHWFFCFVHFCTAPHLQFSNKDVYFARRRKKGRLKMIKVRKGTKSKYSCLLCRFMHPPFSDVFKDVLRKKGKLNEVLCNNSSLYPTYSLNFNSKLRFSLLLSSYYSIIMCILDVMWVMVDNILIVSCSNLDATEWAS